MPIFKNYTAIELVRGVKAFLRLELGLIRGELPDLEQQMGDRNRQPKRKQLSESEQEQTIDKFHRLYYSSGSSGGTWQNTFWLGVPTFKYPHDLWVYQEIIFEVRPDLIVETGTASGGSALFLACMCDLVDKGRVITIDVEDIPSSPQHKRIQYLHGSSTSESIVDQIQSEVADSNKVMIVLDSDHRKEHVLSELKIYNRFVTKGSYLIVEDTCVNGHPVRPSFGPGPMEAVQDFLEGNEDFIVDDSKEKFLLTQNPRGYLKRVK
jgi:cephalosporin hydroxylase